MLPKTVTPSDREASVAMTAALESVVPAIIFSSNGKSNSFALGHRFHLN